MLEPKYAPYITQTTAVTKNGVRYNVLSKAAPEDLKREYSELIQFLDGEAAQGRTVPKF